MKFVLLLLFFGFVNGSTKGNVNGLIPKQIDTIGHKTIVINSKDYVLYDSKNVNKITFDSTEKKRIIISEKAYIEEASIYYRNYCFKIISHFIKDSVDSNEPNLFNPICTKQRIYFYNNKKLIKAIDYPVKSIYQKVSNNKKMLMLEDVINYMGIVKSKSGTFVTIGGWGGCNTCSYFDGIYTVRGAVLASYYGTDIKAIKKNGDVSGVIKRLKINSKEYNQQLYSMIKIYSYPPDRSN